MSSFRSPAPFAALCMAAVLVGCQDQDQIQQYTVAKPEVLSEGSGRLTPTAASADQDPAPETEERYPARTLGAIVPQTDQTWFFKIMGPDEAVAQQDDAFRRFLSTVKFVAGDPAWTLPEGWSEHAAPGSSTVKRFATIRIPGGGQPLELTVISLAALGDQEESLLANVNRWRDQLALPPVTRDSLDEQVERVPLADGTASYVNIAGQALKTDSMSAAPFASAANRGSGFAHPPIPPTTNGSAASKEELPIAFDVPVGWTPGRAGAFTLAAFEIGDANGTPEVTISRMPRQELLSNVNRWRGQVGLEPATEAALPEEAQAIEADGTSGHFVNLVGAEETILGVILNRGGESWIFKLRGPVTLAARERERFEAFVRSVKFNGI
jgi:hypothetical protein